MTSQFTATQNSGKHQFLQWLKTLPEETRWQKLELLVKEDPITALQLANAVLREKKCFELLLEQGLEKANASDIELWLKAVIPRLGFRRTVAILTNKLAEQPEGVAKALYWLPKFLPTESESALAALRDLIRKEKQMTGRGYKAVHPDHD